tara:strand:+ start:167 stop:451 length:285 start_codon:yes stop_codon:yes gene_type:complete
MKISVIFSYFLVMILGSFVINLQQENMIINNEIISAQNSETILIMEKRKLSVEKNNLISDKSVEKIALEELKMKKPSKNEIEFYYYEMKNGKDF